MSILRFNLRTDETRGVEAIAAVAEGLLVSETLRDIMQFDGTEAGGQASESDVISSRRQSSPPS